MHPTSSFVSVTDLFCGAGGSSLGAVAAGGEISIAANHWRRAVETHAANFPRTRHECADVAQCHPRDFPSTDVLLASPECTAHALAKGRKRKNMYQLDFDGKNGIDPSEEKSRVTMWDVPRFAEYHRYNLIIVENVVDSAWYWEPFDAWLMAMDALGYRHQTVNLNSMFAHPTPQSRDRLYVVFWRKSNRAPDLTIAPVAYCPACDADVTSVQSWKKAPTERLGRYGKYGATKQYIYRCPSCRAAVTPYYYAAANAIDWDRRGGRIGDRTRPLAPKTMDRIREGLRRFYGRPFMTCADPSRSPWIWVRPLTGTVGSSTTQDHHERARPPFVDVARAHNMGAALHEPLPTVTTWKQHNLVTPPASAFIMGLEHSGTPGRCYPSDEVYPTRTTRADKALVAPPFLIGLGGPQGQRAPSAIDEALRTQTATRTYGLVVPTGGIWRDQSTDAYTEPQPTLTTTTSAADALARMIVPFDRTGAAYAPDAALRTVTTHDRAGVASVAVDPMDCHFRMLTPAEVGRAMAFPDAYIVTGTQDEQVKQLGNAVTPPVLEILMRRCLETLGGAV